MKNLCLMLVTLGCSMNRDPPSGEIERCCGWFTSCWTGSPPEFLPDCLAAREKGPDNVICSRRGIMEIDLQWLSLLHNSRVPYKMVSFLIRQIHHHSCVRSACTDIAGCQVFTKADKVSDSAAASCVEAGKQQWEMMEYGQSGRWPIRFVPHFPRQLTTLTLCRGRPPTQYDIMCIR